MVRGNVGRACDDSPMERSVVERLREAARQVFPGTPVIFAYVFGSVATGRAREGSDVDVAVYLGPGAGDALERALRLAGELSRASGLGGIDLTVLNDAPLPLKGRVVRERLVLYSRDEPARVRFESLTLREFFDFQLHALRLDLELLRRTAEGRR
jgi:predicted nucleotidyltransferase